MTEIVEIDGSYLEGGGQILRNALSLSCILRLPIRVVKIRSNRPNPGLSNQHLFTLNLLQQVTNARVKGNFIKSTEVEFYPSEIESGKYSVDTKTAASISLVLQAALPVLLFGPSHTELHLFGGTNVGMAPQIDFLTDVVAPNLKLFGVKFCLDVLKRGFYPRGGGHCKASVPPIKFLRAAKITQFGEINNICGSCFVTGNLPEHLAQELKSAATSCVELYCKQPLSIQQYKDCRTRDNGAGLILKAISTEGCVLGAAALGDRRVDVRAMGISAAKDLEKYVVRKICVDQYVQDQLIIFMALAEGTSRIHTCELTDHTKTAIHVAEKLVGVQFDIEQTNDGNFVIQCQGVGHVNKNL